MNFCAVCVFHWRLCAAVSIEFDPHRFSTNKPFVFLFLGKCCVIKVPSSPGLHRSRCFSLSRVERHHESDAEYPSRTHDGVRTLAYLTHRNDARISGITNSLAVTFQQQVSTVRKATVHRSHLRNSTIQEVLSRTTLLHPISSKAIRCTCKEITTHLNQATVVLHSRRTAVHHLRTSISNRIIPTNE